MKCEVHQDDSAIRNENVNETELVEQAQAHPQAFGALYELYYGKILGYIYRRTLDAGVAEDLTSNTFFNALRALPKYANRGQFGAWLYRIATNEINAYRRSVSYRRDRNQQWQTDLNRVSFVASKSGAEQDVADKMRAFAHLRAAVDRLPEKYCTAISLRYFEEMSHAEIAAVLGKRLGTVKSLVHRGLKQLKRQYQDELHEEGLLRCKTNK